MEQVPSLIESIATLLWPIIVIIVLLLFRPSVSAIIESAKSRKFTLKIGGQELTMEEASQLSRSLIADLQTQLVELRKKVEGVPEADGGVVKEVAMGTSAPTSILWVDDHPKNNSYFVEQLSERGISVDLALSTTEGVAKFARGGYRCIISDLGRTENGQYMADAGIKLLKEIRQKDPNIPFIIFATLRGIREYSAQAAALNVTGVTSSPTELFGLLNLEQAKQH